MRRPGSLVTRSYGASVASRPINHSAPVVSTGRPSPQYQRHHDVTPPQVDTTAFRQGWRVASRLDSLLEAGRIDREAWDCAHEWRLWAEKVTPLRQQRWDVRVDVSAVPNDAGMLLRVNAASKLREAVQALGELRIRIIEAVVVRDQSWRMLGQLMRVSDKTARDYAAEAINALADWRCGRTVALPLVLRYRNQPGSL